MSDSRNKVRYTVSPEVAARVDELATPFWPTSLPTIIAVLVREALVANFEVTDELVGLYGKRANQFEIYVADDIWKDAKGDVLPGYAELKERGRLITALLNLWVAGRLRPEPITVTIEEN